MLSLQARNYSLFQQSIGKSTFYHYHYPSSRPCPSAKQTSSHTGSTGIAAAAPQHWCPSTPLHTQRKNRSAALAALMGDVHETSLSGLLATCVLMFVGAYGCGMLPSWLPLSEQRLASVNALGAGLLLGSALAIILPEGFEAAMEAHEESSLPEWSISLALLAGFWCMLLLDTLSHLLPSVDNSSSSSDCTSGDLGRTAHTDFNNGEEHVILLSDAQHGTTGASSQQGTPKATQRATIFNLDPDNTSKKLAGSPAKKGAASTGGGLKHVASAAARDEQVAATQAAASSSSSSNQLQRPVSSVTAKGAAAADSVSSGEVQRPVAGGLAGGAGQVLAGWVREPAQQALLGLVVHAASDGLAVGAASLAAQPAVSLSVAVAMVVHKGPVAVGLSTYLRSAKWSSDRVQKGVLVFSAASPAAALLTYCALSMLPFLSASDNIPLAVLFSGGTVLYAATMHILPDALGRHAHQHQHGSSQGSGGGGAAAGAAVRRVRGSGGKAAVQQTAPSRWQLMLVSAGMLLPLAMSAFFHHDHSH